MVKVFVGTDDEYYLDGYLKSNLDLARGIIKNDWDFCWVVDGGERKGKSLFAQQIGKYVYPELCLDNIVFTPKQFEDAVNVAEPYSCIIYDEAYGGLGSRATMSVVNRTIVRMLTEIGFRNLYILIVLPTYFDLDKYVALWRSRALFHIYTGDDWERGFFCAYNEDAKKDLYVEGKKTYNYKVVKPNFYGRFTNRWMVDKDAYNRKKRDAQKVMRGEDKRSDDEVNDLLFRRLMSNEALSHSERIRALGIPEPTYFRWLKKYKSETFL